MAGLNAEAFAKAILPSHIALSSVISLDIQSEAGEDHAQALLSFIKNHSVIPATKDLALYGAE